MIVINYTLSSDPLVLREQSKMDLATSSLADLCYSCFGGDLKLQINDVDFSIVTGGGVQMLDFSVEFYEATRRVESAGSGRVTFAGMADEIFISKSPSGGAEISANYVDGSSEVSLGELSNSASAFIRQLISDLEREYPKLRSNKEFMRLHLLS
ncbi:hypothetical protein AW27_005780 [Streptomyces sp. PCS3-D2]|uniref:hypothetical protein n=1 Tax=Streptomyces sp. PCS3-D2 TaxID=1460244 RepID=UPI0004496E3F|nr:hypothetical protein [Streptomyces sp. PCS3-D2]WKV71077.1 hypothetical protein AW27_005780 [Streptomyces sp. PCS3-D2]